MTDHHTPDVLGELAAIEQLAVKALASIAAGRATTGVSALNRIRDRAGVASRDELERRRVADLEQQGHDAFEARKRAAGERRELYGFPVIVASNLPADVGPLLV